MGSPVSLHAGPNGDLFYADLTGARVSYYAGNQPPLVSAQADHLSGAVPLTVIFDGTGSSDPDGDAISYAWDLDGDGQYDDSTTAKPSRTYTQPGSYTIGLKVTDSNGAYAIAIVTVAAGNSAPHAVIATPASNLTWKVGDPIHFTGHATDAQDGALPPQALAWTVLLHHCYTPTDCHIHTVEDYNGVDGGSFAAPDHEDLAYIETQLIATDSGGLQDTASVLIGPVIPRLSVQSNPAGMQLALDTGGVTTPASHIVIAGSSKCSDDQRTGCDKGNQQAHNDAKKGLCCWRREIGHRRPLIGKRLIGALVIIDAHIARDTLACRNKVSRSCATRRACVRCFPGTACPYLPQTTHRGYNGADFQSSSGPATSLRSWQLPPKCCERLVDQTLAGG